MTHRSRQYIILLLALLIGTRHASALPEQVAVPPEKTTEPLHQSLLELGLFLGGGYLPDYPGSNQNHFRGLPFPYVVYRGSFVRADDRDGVRARLNMAPRVLMELSFGGSFPVRSKDNDARIGMPDLDWMAEIGPRLTISLTDPLAETRLKLLLPYRAVFSSNFSNLHSRGFSFSPHLLLDTVDFLRPNWRGFMTLGSTFANRELNAYFYDVAPEFATPERPFYDARAGYLGSDLTVGLSIPLATRYRFFTGAQFSYYEGSANVDSPLFKSKTGYTLFSGLSILFYSSHQSGRD